MFKKFFPAICLLLILARLASSQTSQNISATGAQTAVDVTGYSQVSITVTGTFRGANISFEASPASSGTDYYSVSGVRRDSEINASANSTGPITNRSQSWLITVSGFLRFRLNCTAITSGTVNAKIATITGGVATQPISAASLPLPALASTSTKQSDGSQKTQVVDGSGNVIGATSNALDVNLKSGSLAANQSVNEAQINGVAPSMGNGTSGTGVQRVAIASDNTANSNPWLAQPVPGTANGLLISATQSAASTNSTSVKGSAGVLYHVSAVNTTATLYYLRFYNLASGPTCSSATGFIMTIPIPASTSGAGIVLDSNFGFTFGTGIGFCLTGGGSSTDNTNAATGVFVNLGYK